MSMPQPLVSICIPTYNGAAYVDEAMESALKQDYPNVEIVVSDDGSLDDTVAIVESFRVKTSIPIHVYIHTPSGIGANWNHCVKKAKGEFIKFLFQDDVLYHNCISEQMAWMQRDAEVGLVYCKRDFLYAPSEREGLDAFMAYYGDLQQYWGSFTEVAGIREGRQYLGDRQFLNSPKNKVGEPTVVLLRKAVFERVGYFDTELEQTLDCEFWYRVMSQYKVGFIDAPLAGFRLHQAQASNVNKTRDLPDRTLLYQRYYQKLFWYLHPKCQWKLLKLYHPFFKALVNFKRQFYAT